MSPSSPKEPNWKRLHIDADQATEFWNEVVPEFDRYGLISKVDRRLLIDYVRCVVRLNDVEAEIEMTGPVVLTHQGAARSNPAVQAAASYRTAIHRYEQELGVGAANRASMRQVASDEPKKASGWSG